MQKSLRCTTSRPRPERIAVSDRLAKKNIITALLLAAVAVGFYGAFFLVMS